MESRVREIPPFRTSLVSLPSFLRKLFLHSDELLSNVFVTVRILCCVLSMVFVILENTLADQQTEKLIVLFQGWFILQTLGT